MISEEIYSKTIPLSGLIRELGFDKLRGKELKNKLKPFKIGNYNDWDRGGYVKRSVYKYNSIYYS